MSDISVSDLINKSLNEHLSDRYPIIIYQNIGPKTSWVRINIRLKLPIYNIRFSVPLFWSKLDLDVRNLLQKEAYMHSVFRDNICVQVHMHISGRDNWNLMGSPIGKLEQPCGVLSQAVLQCLMSFKRSQLERS